MSIGNLLGRMEARMAGLDAARFHPMTSYAPPPVARTEYGTFNPNAPNAPPNDYGPIPYAGVPWINDIAGPRIDKEHGLYRAYTLLNRDMQHGKGNDVLELVSTDLAHWQTSQIRVPKELAPKGTLWGGDAGIVDEKGVAGYGKGAVLYFFSSFGDPNPVTPAEPYQYILGYVAPAFGQTPVSLGVLIHNPVGGGVNAGPGFDFRDPRVDWDGDHQCWVMKICVNSGVAFYTSTDLLHWKFASTYWVTKGDQVECFNMFPVVSTEGDRKWLLTFCAQKPRPCAQFLVGDWDGSHFTPESPAPGFLTYGPDDYGHSSFLDREGQLCNWGWRSRWQYSWLPYEGFHGQLTKIRRLVLTRHGPGGDGTTWQVLTPPVPTLSTLYGPETKAVGGQVIGGPNTPAFTFPAMDTGIAYRLQLVLKAVDGRWPDEVELRFRVSQDGQTYTSLKLVPADHQVIFNRAHSGQGLNIPAWTQDYPAPADCSGLVSIDAHLDASAVDLFINSGQAVISSLIFPPDEALGLSLAAKGTGQCMVCVCKLSVY